MTFCLVDVHPYPSKPSCGRDASSTSKWGACLHSCTAESLSLEYECKHSFNYFVTLQHDGLHYQRAFDHRRPPHLSRCHPFCATPFPISHCALPWFILVQDRSTDPLVQILRRRRKARTSMWQIQQWHEMYGLLSASARQSCISTIQTTTM